MAKGNYVSTRSCREEDNITSSCDIKGIVQRKLRWVESGVNRWVMLQYWGAGHYFLILKGHYLVFLIKRFAAT